MKLKRTLSLLLAAMLTVSSVPMTVFAAEQETSQAQDITWSDNVASMSDTPDASDEGKYVHLYNIAQVGRTFSYVDPAITLDAAKTYRLSFMIRGVNLEKENGFSRTVTVCLDDNNKPLNSANAIGSVGADTSTGQISVPENEWKSVYFTFKGNSKALKLIFKQNDVSYSSSLKNVTPFDIRGLSLYEINGVGHDVGSNLIEHEFDRQPAVGAGWVYGNNKVEFFEDCDFLRVPSASGTANAAAEVSGLSLEPGKYSLSAKFRLNTLDFDLAGKNGSGYYNSVGYTAKLSVSETNENFTLAGTTTLALTTEWKQGTFTLDVDKTTDAGAISFALDKYVGFDIADFEITKLVSYTDDYIAKSGVKIEEKGSADADEYVYVYNVKSATAYPTYNDSSVTLDASKTYKLSFKLRADASSDANTALGYASSWSDTSLLRLAKVKVAGVQVLDSLKMYDTWREYSVEFTGKSGALKIQFTEQGFDELVPYSIADLSLTEVGSDTELIKYGTTLDAANGWSLNNTNATLAIAADTVYYSLPENGGSTNAFTFAADGETLTSGIWRISGDFRLADYKIANLDRNVSTAYDTVKANNNKAELKVLYNGTALKAVDGSDAASVTTMWTNAAFELTVAQGKTVSVSDLEFILGDGIAYDFRNIEFTDVSGEYSSEYVRADGESIKKNGGADAEEYVYVYDVKSATAYPTYNDSSVILDASKTYKLSFSLRADASTDANTALGYASSWGDTSILRLAQVKVSDERVLTTIKLYDTWKEYSTEFTGKSGALKIQFTEQGFDELVPYSIADLSLIEVGSGTELIKYGTVLDAENGWSLNNTNAALMITSDTEYYSIAPYSENTAFKHNGVNGHLDSGIYYITGEFRLADYKIANLDRNISTAYDTVKANNNKASFEIIYNGKPLTVVGSTATDITVTTNWTQGSFLLNVSDINGIEKSELLFTIDESTALDYRNLQFICADEYYLDTFESGDGSPIAIIKENHDTYVHAYNVQRWDSELTYSDASVTLEAGKTYKVSFDARTAATVNWSNTKDGKGYRQIRFNITGAKLVNADGTPIYKTDGVTPMYTGNKTYILYDEWNEYTFYFIPDANTSLTMKIYGMSVDDILPIDIADLSVTSVDTASGTTGKELVNYRNMISDALGWRTNRATAEIYSGGEHYNVSAPTDGSVTSIRIAKDGDLLEPGVYHITGKFRLASPVDFNKISIDRTNPIYPVIGADTNVAAVSAAAGNGTIQLSTLSGGAEVSINPYNWSEVTFVLDTAAEIDVGTIMFMLNGAYALDFCDVDVSLVERKTSLSEVNGGIIMTLLLLKKQQEATRVPENEYAALNGELIAKRGSEITNKYVQFYNVKSASAYLTYTDSSITLNENKTYELSFNVRANPSSDFTEVYRDSWGLTHRAANISVAGKRVKSGVLMSDDWKTYSFRFNGVKGELKIQFTECTFKDLLPFCVDDLSLIEVASDKELIKHGETVGETGWSVSNTNGSVKIAKENTYYRVEAPESGNTAFTTKGNKQILTKGVWYVTGDFRLADYKYSKLETTTSNFGWVTVTANNNESTLKVYLDDVSQPTASDSLEGIKLTSDWTEATFKITVDNPEGISVNDVVFMLDDNTAFDFKSVEFINEADMSSNFIKDAVSEKALANWNANGQSLTYMVDEDGTGYLAARNIINNHLGFTYNSGEELDPGIYIFSGDFRTAVEGETGHTRVIFADTPYTVILSNEWAHMEFMVSVDEAMPLEFIVRGSTIATSIQDYDIANLSLVDLASTIPSDTELYEAGNFDDKESALANWSTYNTYDGGNLTHVTEDGNGFLRMSNRGNEYCGLMFLSDIYIYEGGRFKISYDIRCADKGKEMVARSYRGSTPKDIPLDVNGEIYQNYTYMYPITNEWRHVEIEFVCEDNRKLTFKVAGGMDPVRDIRSFDIDNLSIMKLD